MNSEFTILLYLDVYNQWTFMLILIKVQIQVIQPIKDHNQWPAQKEETVSWHSFCCLNVPNVVTNILIRFVFSFYAILTKPNCSCWYFLHCFLGTVSCPVVAWTKPRHLMKRRRGCPRLLTRNRQQNECLVAVDRHLSRWIPPPPPVGNA